VSKNNGKSVDYARTHGPIFVPNSGQFGPELDTLSAGSRVVSMEIDDPFLTVVIKESKSQKLVTIPIPLSNLSHMRLSSIEKNSK
jgi:hypothetical protein